MSYNLFLFTSQPTFYFNLKTKISCFYLTVIGLENLVCRFNPSVNLMYREDAQCLLTSAAPMKPTIYFQIEQVQQPLIQLAVNIKNTGDI